MSGFVLIYVFVMDMPPLRTLYNTLGRDLRSLRMYYRFLSFLKKCYLENQTVVELFHANVAKHPDRVCFIFEDEEWTFKKVNDLSNKIAHCFRLQGYEKGDEVALFMENCPDYVCMWLGLAKIGVITALINTNQRKETLAHSMNIIDMKGCIFGESLAESMASAIPFLDKKNVVDFYCYSRKSEDGRKLEIESWGFPSKSLNVLLEDAPSTPLDPEKFKPDIGDKLMYIYTSGTTGLPKAAIIKHNRFLRYSAGTPYFYENHEQQVVYNPLPMYHSAGGVLFLGGVLIYGYKMVLRKKFSASQFWKEVVQHKVTVCQYIGEICRYLLNQPKVPEESQHCVWLFFGNGLRPHVWKEFQERFGIKKIIEFYGSTEGVTNLVNIYGKEGSVGFISLLFSRIRGYPVFLIKVNPETGEVLRDQDGLCIRCKPGEPGELVGSLSTKGFIGTFDGYVNSVENKKKIIRDCFRKGDLAFASGDILVMDEDGYMYFLDRTGDTFRWKGENVSSGQVEDIVSKALNHATCVVYGVQIPGAEGRAGMAAIQANEQSIDFELFYENIADRLPTYALPMFIRICPDIETTGTHKLRKVNLQKQGFSIEEISDPLYMVDTKRNTYIPLTKQIHSDVLNGRMRL